MARRARRGAQAIEFALLLPVLMILFAAIVDYGHFFYVQHDLVVATQESARDGAMASALSDPVAIAEERAWSSLEEFGLSSTTAVVHAETFGVVPDMGLRTTITLKHTALVGMVPLPDTLESSIAARLWYQPKPLPPEI